MNERIKELADQCTENVDDGGYGYDVFDKKKFAELIVQECGVALSPMLRDMISRGHAYDLIKQHFGVDK